MQFKKLSIIALAVAAAFAQLAQASEQSESKGFVEDSNLVLLNKNFAFYRDFHNNPGGQNYRNEWAHGILATYESGFTQGTVGFGVDAHAMLGLKLNSGGGTNGTGLLPVGDDGKADDDYSEAGGAIKVRVSSTTLKYGNLMPTGPVFATGTARLLPGTAEGFQLLSNEIDGLNLDAGHFTSTNDVNSSNHDGEILAAYAGVAADSADYVGGSYSINDDVSVSLYGSEFEDVWRQYYGNLNYNIPLGTERALNFDFNIYKTSETGDELVGKIDNTTWSLAAAYSMGAHKFTLAHQRVNGDEPFDFLALGEGQSGDSIFLANSVQYSDFNGPNEKSWQVRYDLDMASYGVPGLSFMARYITGDDIDGTKADPTGAYAGVYGDNQKHWERNLEAKYVVQEGAAKDLSFRIRHATHRATAFDSDLDEIRVITEYPLDIL
ncbi:OprD family porin [Pseudomonas sp. AN-1]|uniref:OprD family porin n=1 Tax=Pseudomonas sp. AN-1 TaxID=3096605 RepID=UPI002A6B71F1|nr:OprD family porin [Pseudomonas sp. AN-1]WPP47665.1 OprD family porin [Pseudomonas sp. AN-1]